MRGSRLNGDEEKFGRAEKERRGRGMRRAEGEVRRDG